MMANNFMYNISNYIGQTVTVFAACGGESGRGFTGVLAMVNPDFIRLITQIGPAPACALGNCCDYQYQYPMNLRNIQDDYLCIDGEKNSSNDDKNVQNQANYTPNERRIDCRGNHGLGCVVDIPVDKIVSFVHNAVGGGW
ncbi:hypothetical protein [Clostridium prolinivorans]|uniref:hypothetical protein n=1 Tax=Clostridium prolinivorans TaxID=2769420 RepID=UPI000FDAC318|nr:hypothetical protein [Clostridium prolinivorans]